MITLERHLKQKRDELIWALSLQDYTDAQVARLFGIGKVTVKRIMLKKPKDWKPKWVKEV